jgi:hypothetical protein
MRLPSKEDFTPWPKIARQRKAGVIVTEKIDGTNAAINVRCIYPYTGLDGDCCTVIRDGAEGERVHFELTVQSRKRWLAPGKLTDNFGFAGWVEENKETLVDDLGPGLHFGEWWGAGIQRRYDQEEKHFALFDTRRADQTFTTPNVRTVPVLYQGAWSTPHLDGVKDDLKLYGSAIAPGFKDPEGIVIFCPAVGARLKWTTDGDGHKG